jgi:hypothetical protein
MGPAVPGHHLAVGKRVERVRAVPGLRRRNPAGHLPYQRHLIRQRPLPARGQGQGTSEVHGCGVGDFSYRLRVPALRGRGDLCFVSLEHRDLDLVPVLIDRDRGLYLIAVH